MLGTTNISKGRFGLARVALAALAVLCSVALGAFGAGKAFAETTYEASVPMGIWVQDASSLSEDGVQNSGYEGGAYVSNAQLGLWITDSGSSDGTAEGEHNYGYTESGDYYSSTQMGLWVTDSSFDGGIYNPGEYDDASGSYITSTQMGLWVTSNTDEQLTTTINSQLSSELGMYVTNKDNSAEAVRVSWDLGSMGQWADGAQGVKSQTVDLGDGPETLTVPAGISNVPGYYLAGWELTGGYTLSTEGDATSYEIDLPGWVDYTITAVWQPRAYNVTLDSAEGALPEEWASGTKTFAANDTVTLPAPTREGYTFGGWMGAPSNSFEAVTLESADITAFAPSVDVSYTAAWTADEAKIVFESKYNGVEVGTLAFDSLTGVTDGSLDGKDFPEITDVTAGYTSLGWFDAEGTQITALPGAYPPGTTTYYAKWSVDNYQVEFYSLGADEGKVDALSEEVNSAGTVTMPDTLDEAHKVAGHKLSRWYVFNGNTVPSLGEAGRLDLAASTDSTLASYAPGDVVNVTDLAQKVGEASTIKLYATWTPVYSLTMPVDGSVREVTLKRGVKAAVTSNGTSRPEITMTSTTPRAVDLFAMSDVNDGADSNVAKVLGLTNGVSDLTEETYLNFAKSVTVGNEGSITDPSYDDARTLPLNGTDVRYVGTASANDKLIGTLVLHLSDPVSNSITLEANDVTNPNWGALTTVKWFANIGADGTGPDTGSWLYASADASSFDGETSKAFEAGTE